MVGNHIPQGAGCVIETAAMPNPQLLRDRYLHVIDVIAIPDRFEHAIGEAQHQDVLDRLLAQIVIYPVDLVLIEYF